MPLDHLPEHAVALGRLLGHWAFLENMLIGTLALALKIEHPIAKVLWQEFVSVRGKITLLQRLNHSMKDDDFKTELGKLLATAQELNKVRNGYIHALWVINANNEVERQSNTAPGDYKKVFKNGQVIAATDIEADVLKIAKLSADLIHWQRRIRVNLPGMRLEPIETPQTGQ